MKIIENYYMETGKKRCINDDYCARSTPDEMVKSGSSASYQECVRSRNLKKFEFEVNGADTVEKWGA